MSAQARELLRQAEQAFVAGDLRAAIAHADQAERVARAAGDGDLADRAVCNRAAFRIDLGEGHDEIVGLKRLLLSSGDHENQLQAAYYVAQAYYHEDELEQARSYARRAVGLAEGSPDRSRRAACCNLFGILAMKAAEFDDAETSLRQALALYDSVTDLEAIMAAQVRDNLGYVHMCTDRLASGIGHCEEARRALDELDADHYVYEVLQDLCYGYILDDRLELAEKCGERALDLAFHHDDDVIVKNCLFLLGETAIRRGDTFRARRRLRELTQYYPEVGLSDEIVDVFLATDLLQVVNLKG